VSSPYDAFASLYDRYWAAPFRQWQRPALERLLFPNLPRGARVLDLCCGTGQLAQQLVNCGYEVTGIDSSKEMLSIAREKVPAAEFVHADAADFSLEQPVDSAVCGFDSLNHILEKDRLELAFRKVYAALKPGGWFVFDVNTAGAYGEIWNQSACEVHSDSAFFLRGAFDRQTRIGKTLITMFRLAGSNWERSDIEVRQRPWEISEIEPMLEAQGFGEIHSYRPVKELGMAGHYGTGRVYFRACRSSNE
jgi:SAM-dependent methyltransferase